MAGPYQMNRFRIESNAPKKAAKQGFTEKELAIEMTNDMANTNSASTLMEAAAIICYLNAVNGGATPTADALARLEAKNAPAPSGCPEPA